MSNSSFGLCDRLHHLNGNHMHCYYSGPWFNLSNRSSPSSLHAFLPTNATTAWLTISWAARILLGKRTQVRPHHTILFSTLYLHCSRSFLLFSSGYGESREGMRDLHGSYGLKKQTVLFVRTLFVLHFPKWLRSNHIERYTPWQIIVSTLTALYAVRNFDKILGLECKLPLLARVTMLTSAIAPEPLARLVSLTSNGFNLCYPTVFPVFGFVLSCHMDKHRPWGRLCYCNVYSSQVASGHMLDRVFGLLHPIRKRGWSKGALESQLSFIKIYW